MADDIDFLAELAGLPETQHKIMRDQFFDSNNNLIFDANLFTDLVTKTEAHRKASTDNGNEPPAPSESLQSAFAQMYDEANKEPDPAKLNERRANLDKLRSKTADAFNAVEKYIPAETDRSRVADVVIDLAQMKPPAAPQPQQSQPVPQADLKAQIDRFAEITGIADSEDAKKELTRHLQSADMETLKSLNDKFETSLKQQDFAKPENRKTHDVLGAVLANSFGDLEGAANADGKQKLADLRSKVADGLRDTSIVQSQNSLSLVEQYTASTAIRPYQAPAATNPLETEINRFADIAGISKNEFAQKLLGKELQGVDVDTLKGLNDEFSKNLIEKHIASREDRFHAGNTQLGITLNDSFKKLEDGANPESKQKLADLRAKLSDGLHESRSVINQPAFESDEQELASRTIRPSAQPVPTATLQTEIDRFAGISHVAKNEKANMLLGTALQGADAETLRKLNDDLEGKGFKASVDRNVDGKGDNRKFGEALSDSFSKLENTRSGQDNQKAADLRAKIQDGLNKSYHEQSQPNFQQWEQYNASIVIPLEKQANNFADIAESRQGGAELTAALKGVEPGRLERLNNLTRDRLSDLRINGDKEPDKLGRALKHSIDRMNEGASADDRKLNDAMAQKLANGLDASAQQYKAVADKVEEKDRKEFNEKKSAELHTAAETVRKPSEQKVDPKPDPKDQKDQKADPKPDPKDEKGTPKQDPKDQKAAPKPTPQKQSPGAGRGNRTHAASLKGDNSWAAYGGKPVDSITIETPTADGKEQYKVNYHNGTEYSGARPDVDKQFGANGTAYVNSFRSRPGDLGALKAAEPASTGQPAATGAPTPLVNNAGGNGAKQQVASLPQPGKNAP